MKKSVAAILVFFLTASFVTQGRDWKSDKVSKGKAEYSFFLRDLQKLIVVNKALAEPNLNNAIDELLLLSEANLKKGRVDYAMRQIFRAQEILQQHKIDYDLSARCKQMLGSLFFTRYMREESVSFFQQSIELFIAAKNPNGAAEVLSSMMESYFMLDDTISAQYCIKALSLLSKKIGSDYIAALENETIGDFNYLTGDFNNSVNYYKKSLYFYSKLGNYEKISNVLLSLGLSDFNAGYNEKAFNWVDSALTLNKIHNQPKNYYEALYFKAMLISVNDPSSSLTLAYSVLDTLDEMQLYIHLGVYLKLIIDLERQTEDFRNALLHSDRLKLITNTISGSNVERTMASLQLEVESQKLNNRIGLLQKEQELVSVNTRSQRNMLFYFFLTIIVLFAMALNNMRRLQYRLYLLKEFALDFTWPQYMLAFFVSLLYFLLLLAFINPLNLSQPLSLYSLLNYSIIAFLLSGLATAGISLLPASWSAKPGFNRRFFFMAFVFILLINVSILLYSLFTGLLGNSFFDYINVVLVVTGITIIPVFYFIIYLEKVLLRKHIQMAGLLSNRIQTIKPDEKGNLITIYSKRSRDILEVPANNLLLVEANGNYSKAYYLEDNQLKSMLILTSLTNAYDQLASHECFSRCHNSFIVNLNKITKVTGNSHGYKLIISFFDNPIPVSRGYVAEFFKNFDAIFKGGAQNTEKGTTK